MGISASHHGSSEYEGCHSTLTQFNAYLYSGFARLPVLIIELLLPLEVFFRAFVVHGRSMIQEDDLIHSQLLDLSEVEVAFILLQVAVYENQGIAFVFYFRNKDFAFWN
jgi:hypothetical protein